MKTKGRHVDRADRQKKVRKQRIKWSLGEPCSLLWYGVNLHTTHVDIPNSIHVGTVYGDNTWVLLVHAGMYASLS